MIFIILFVILMTAYPVIGMMVAKNEYTKAFRYYNNNQDSCRTQLISQKRIEHKNLHHRTYCYLVYPPLEDIGCSCDTKNKWWTLKKEIEKLEAGQIIKPSIPSGVVWGWPGVLVNNYIVSDTNNLPDYAEIARKEKELLP